MKNLREYIRNVIKESAGRTRRVFDSPEPFGTFRNVRQKSPAFPSKPEGLWYSCGDSWKEWVEEEMFGADRYQFSYEIEINSAAMYMISSKEDIEKFHEKYITRGKFEKVIDWKAVQDDGYAGIEICPYRSEKRMSPSYFWYYTWDVASGCIWDKAAILSIREITGEG